MNNNYCYHDDRIMFCFTIQICLLFCCFAEMALLQELELTSTRCRAIYIDIQLGHAVQTWLRFVPRKYVLATSVVSIIHMKGLEPEWCNPQMLS